MKRKKKRRYNLETIVLSLIFVPPLGFFLLWITARSRRTRGIVLASFVLFLALAAGVFFKSGMYSRLRGPSIPSSGFDITHDSRGRYQTQEILPFERTIFSEVVREMQRIPPDYGGPKAEPLSMEAVQPEYKAFEIIASRRDMNVDDVKGIYLKVTTQLASGEKGKK